MEEKMVRCTEYGFSLGELHKYVQDKLNALEVKNNVEGITSSWPSIVRAAFESADIQALIEKRKVYVKVPDHFIGVFNVTPEGWKADIPFSAAVSAVDKEISDLCNRYEIKE